MGSRWKIVLIAVLIPATASCSSRQPFIRPSGPTAHAETRLWCDEILRQGRDGDWLVVRGYTSSGHFVAAAAVADFSHVGILDATNGEVVEAVSPAVHAISLYSFLEEADRVLLIRPDGMDSATGNRALARARSQIGAPYDVLGTIGLPEEGRYYCSELAAWSIGREVDVAGAENVLHPVSMSNLGGVLFDSDSRAGGWGG